MLSRRYFLELMSITSTTAFMNPFGIIEVPKLWIPEQKFIGNCTWCQGIFSTFPKLTNYLSDDILKMSCLLPNLDKEGNETNLFLDMDFQSTDRFRGKVRNLLDRSVLYTGKSGYGLLH